MQIGGVQGRKDSKWKRSMNPKGRTTKSHGLIFLLLTLLFGNYCHKIGWTKGKVWPWLNLHLITETVYDYFILEYCGSAYIMYFYCIQANNLGILKIRDLRHYTLYKIHWGKKIYQRYVKNIKAWTITCYSHHLFKQN